MKITILSLGHTFSDFENQWMDIYKKRLGRFVVLEHKHIKDKFETYQDTNHPKYIQWLQEIVPKDCFLIALDEKGKTFSTQSFHQNLANLETLHKHIVFFVGGSYGIPHAILEQAKLKLSLGLMTYPHKIALLILLEQIYRSYTIANNIPYHHS